MFPYIFYFMFENTYRYTANTPIPSDWRFKGLIVSLYFLFHVGKKPIDIQQIHQFLLIGALRV